MHRNHSPNLFFPFYVADWLPDLLCFCCCCCFPDKSKSLKYDGIKSIMGGENSAGGMYALSTSCVQVD